MPRALSISALGTIVAIDGSELSEDSWALVMQAWQDAATESVDVPASVVVANGSVAPSVMLAALSVDVTLAALKAQAGRLLMLHAAGLATQDGAVVALVGPSGRGKTTASRVLGRTFGYVTDESVAVELDGRVLPYRKPLSVIEHDQGPKVQRSPSELGLAPVPQVPLRLAGLVLLERDEAALEARLDSVDAAEAIVALSEQASYLGRLPSPLHAIASMIQSVGAVHRLRYSDASTIAPLIADLATRQPTALPKTVGRRVAHPRPAMADPPSGPSFARMRVLDSLSTDDGREIVLRKNGELAAQVLVLDGLAPIVWHMAARRTSVDTMAAAAVEELGAPVGGDPTELISGTAEQLVEAGLLRRA